MVGWFGLLSPPCGYCLEASMTREVGVGLVVTPPCGYCLEASMTREVGVGLVGCLALWILP